MEKTIEIPEGYEARIEGNKVILELAESQDERIRKAIVEFFELQDDNTTYSFIPKKNILAWLEKQGEKTEDKLQVSDELYEHIRNTCACIDDALSSETLVDINDYLSMAERSAQSAFDMIEKQGSQNLANSEKTCKVEQNPAWSEEDEKMLNRCIEYASNIVPVKATKESGLFVDFKRVPDEKVQDWLKSLKSRYTWKPSEQDILLLERIVNGKSNPQDFQASLQLIIGQLKKLKG